MNKLDLETPDFVASNAARLAELFPNCVTETKQPDGTLKRAIDFDLLRQELSHDLVEGAQERYRLDWPGKREALALANAPIRKTLRPCKDESVDFDTTRNLYIEGDNLDALKLLQETYLGKVKMIYIDPPYNTGNDFIYDDNFSISREKYDDLAGARDEEGNAMFDEEKWKHNSSSNGRFHSEWLSMIYPRLKLARNLLREEGVVFISIDDTEVHNLRKVCDEIFGANSFIGTISRSTGTRMGTGSKGLSRELDSIVIYGRSSESCINNLPMTPAEMKIYDLHDGRGRYLLRSLRRTGGENRREDRPNMFYAVTSPGGDEVYPIAPEGWDSRWVCVKETYDKLFNEGEIEWKQVLKGGSMKWQVYQKHYLKGSGRETSDLWTKVDGNKMGTKELNRLFGNVKLFSHPKPVGLISRILQLGSRYDECAIILDFFSGSATTAHAVMQLNAEDGGNRRHIMVQLPEPCDEKSEAFKADYPTIAEIGKERIRRAGKKIRAELEAKLAKELKGSEEHTSLKSRLDSLDTGFRVLKIDSSNMADVYYEPDKLAQGDLAMHVDNLKSGRNPEDLLFQVLLDWGVDFALPITEEVIQKHRVFFVAENALAACFDTGLNEDFVKELAKRQPLRAVFRDSGYANDAVKINFEQIFKALSPHTEIKTL